MIPNKTMQAMLMPEDEGGVCWMMDFYTNDGVWLYTLFKNRRQTFAKHLDERASQWKHGDPDIYAEMMEMCVKADTQAKRTNA